MNDRTCWEGTLGARWLCCTTWRCHSYLSPCEWCFLEVCSGAVQDTTARSPRLIAWVWSKGRYLGVTTRTILRSHVWKFLSRAVISLMTRENICRKIYSLIIAPENYVSSLKNVTVHVHILCFSIPWVPHTWCEAFFPLPFWQLEYRSAQEDWGFGKIATFY